METIHAEKGENLQDMDSTQFRHVGCMCINCEFYSFMSTHQEQYYHKSVEATQEELVIAQKMLYSHLYLGDEMLWDQSNPVLLTIGMSTIWYHIGSDSILIAVVARHCLLVQQQLTCQLSLQYCCTCCNSVIIMDLSRCDCLAML